LRGRAWRYTNGMGLQPGGAKWRTSVAWQLELDRLQWGASLVQGRVPRPSSQGRWRGFNSGAEDGGDELQGKIEGVSGGQHQGRTD
jgi:hypothetical protein